MLFKKFKMKGLPFRDGGGRGAKHQGVGGVYA